MSEDPGVAENLYERRRKSNGSVPALVLTPADALDRSDPEPVPLSPLLSPGQDEDLERWEPAPDHRKGSSSRHAYHTSQRMFVSRPAPSHTAPLPTLPQRAEAGQPAGIQAKLLRTERATLASHIWHRWTGYDAMRSVGTSMSALSPYHVDYAPPALPTRDAENTPALGTADFPTIGVLHRDSSSEPRSMTPSLRSGPSRGASPSPSCRASSAATLPGILRHTRTASQEQARLTDAQDLPESEALRVSDLCANVEALSPNDTAASSRQGSVTALSSRSGIDPLTKSESMSSGLAVPWRQIPMYDDNDDDDDGTYSSYSSSSSDDESPGLSRPSLPPWLAPYQQHYEYLPTISLSHGSTLTNKQMHSRMRRRRRVPAELRDDAMSNSQLWSHLRSYRLRPEADASLSVSPPRRESPQPSLPHAASRKHSHAGGHPSLASKLQTRKQRGDSDDVASVESNTLQPPGASRPSVRPRVWRRRERRAWNEAPAANDLENDGGDGVPNSQRSRRTSTQPMRAMPTAPQSKTTQGEPDFVYDMLHENQRGIVLFGVSKRFSSNVLFFWDPAPWTDAHGINTALTPTTMQLPDESWEWVHSSWMVDMTGDTDEDGWQYSGSFTGPQIWRRTPQIHSHNGPTQWMQAILQKAHLAEEKHIMRVQERDNKRADEGMEAFLRTMRFRTRKWHSVPGVFSYVRRRRWVRLRRRIVNTSLPEGMRVLQADGSSTVVPPASVAEVLQSATKSRSPIPSKSRQGGLPTISTSSTAPTPEVILVDPPGLHAGRRGAHDETPAPSLLAPTVARSNSSSSSPRPSVSSGASDLSQSYQLSLAKDRLHQLLPFFLVPPSHLPELLPPDTPPLHEMEAWRRHFRFILEQETFFQNPFFALGWVQRWLARSDLSQVTRPLRAQERAYQNAYRADPWCLDVPVSSLSRRNSSPNVVPRLSLTPAECLLLSLGDTQSSQPAPTLVRQAVVEHNFEMVILAMRLCTLDRLRIDMWRMWLGLLDPAKLLDATETGGPGPLTVLQQEWHRRRARTHDIHALGKTPAMFSPSIERILRNRIRDFGHSKTVLLDVWDILVAHVCTRYALTWQLEDIYRMMDHDMSRHWLQHIVQDMADTKFYLHPQTSSEASCPHPGDPRWRFVRSGVLQLPRVPTLQCCSCPGMVST